MDRAFGLLSEGFGLSPDQRRMLLRILWVIFVTTHILWVCGFLAIFGLPSPFAKASDVERIAQSADISARISLAQEIRTYAAARCKADDQEPYNRIIERLQIDYELITGARYAEPRCP
jgi:hypothetical protein